MCVILPLVLLGVLGAGVFLLVAPYPPNLLSLQLKPEKCVNHSFSRTVERFAVSFIFQIAFRVPLCCMPVKGAGMISQVYTFHLFLNIIPTFLKRSHIPTFLTFLTFQTFPHF